MRKKAGSCYGHRLRIYFDMHSFWGEQCNLSFHAPCISGVDKTRDELRMQVYDAMAEKKTTNGEDGKAEPKEEGKGDSEAVAEGKKETMETEAKEEDAAKSPAKNGRDEKSKPPVDGVEETLFAPEDESRKEEEAVKEIVVKASEEQNVEEKMEEEGEVKLMSCVGIICLGAPSGLGLKNHKNGSYTNGC